MLKPYYDVDDNGSIIEYYLGTDEDITKDREDGKKIVDFPWGAGMFSPKFDFTSNNWVEGATQAEIGTIKNVPAQPTELELLKKQQTDIAFELMLKGVL